MTPAYFLVITALMLLSSGCNNSTPPKTAEQANAESKPEEKELVGSSEDPKSQSSTEYSKNLVNFDSLHWGLGRGHKTDAFIEVAISLQKLGREAACKELMKFAKSERPKGPFVDDSFMVLCRMLFTVRRGKEFRRPMIGEATVSEELMKQTGRSNRSRSWMEHRLSLHLVILLKENLNPLKCT